MKFVSDCPLSFMRRGRAPFPTCELAIGVAYFLEFNPIVFAR